MKLNRILCPIDYSEFSKAANFYASTLAKITDAEIIFVHVAYPPYSDSQIEDEIEAEMLEFSHKIRPFIPEVRHCFEICCGNPADKILEMAKQRNVDLIVMGTHGRTGSSRLLHGSVCENVLRHAVCPVMVVKSSIDPKWVLPTSDDHIES